MATQSIKKRLLTLTIEQQCCCRKVCAISASKLVSVAFQKSEKPAQRLLAVFKKLQQTK
jgi:hypothetical protein